MQESRKTTVQVCMDPGTYFVGDLCYVLGDSWDEFCNLTLTKDGVREGGTVFSDGREMCSFTTLYGDGVYQDAEGRDYPVDAGLLGCIKLENMDLEYDEICDSGQIIVFKNQFICERVDGMIYFGKIAIQTDSEPEYQSRSFDRNLEREPD